MARRWKGHGIDNDATAAAPGLSPLVGSVLVISWLAIGICLRGNFRKLRPAGSCNFVVKQWVRQRFRDPLAVAVPSWLLRDASSSCGQDFKPPDGRPCSPFSRQRRACSSNSLDSAGRARFLFAAVVCWCSGHMMAPGCRAARFYRATLVGWHSRLWSHRASARRAAHQERVPAVRARRRSLLVRPGLASPLSSAAACRPRDKWGRGVLVRLRANGGRLWRLARRGRPSDRAWACDRTALASRLAMIRHGRAGRLRSKCADLGE